MTDIFEHEDYELYLIYLETKRDSIISLFEKSKRVFKSKQLILEGINREIEHTKSIIDDFQAQYIVNSIKLDLCCETLKEGSDLYYELADVQFSKLYDNDDINEDTIYKAKAIFYGW